jgi:hypothetical protein
LIKYGKNVKNIAFNIGIKKICLSKTENLEVKNKNFKGCQKGSRGTVPA